MHAIILAAGMGNRLRASGHAGPKCLLEFDGETLLDRHLRALGQLGIDTIDICVGWQADAIREHLAELPFEGHVHTVYNPDYAEGSIVSLWCMRGALRRAGDVLLMDADVLYATEILRRLVVSPIRNCFLLDRDFEPGAEPVKLCGAGGRLVEFSKQPDPGIPCDWCGESVGFFRFGGEVAGQLAALTERYLAQGRRQAPYEDAIRDLLREDSGRFGYEDVTGLPWIEIDFPDDVERARQRVLPAIHGR